jgi:hypothetical protein
MWSRLARHETALTATSSAAQPTGTKATTDAGHLNVLPMEVINLLAIDQTEE